MARLARVVVTGLPHLITQRGNRRQQTFYCDENYRSYLELMGQWCGAHQVEIWAYCLMPNHVHLIAVPQSADGLRRAVGEAHRRYTRLVNFREGWRGHLWQGRFASIVLDERYLLTAARYVELNPVRAGLRKKRTGIAADGRPAGKPIAPGVDRPVDKRRDDGRGVAIDGPRGLSFEEWGDLSVGIASSVKNKRRLGRRDRTSFGLWQPLRRCQAPRGPVNWPWQTEEHENTH